mmetsp:Transcript_10870/g.16445  ORF Transcript_10870/g.16445 Transcript_10870/m.16445 type:complete len:797 (+) Transcript_10870:86-2476(+)
MKIKLSEVSIRHPWLRILKSEGNGKRFKDSAETSDLASGSICTNVATLKNTSIDSNEPANIHGEKRSHESCHEFNEGERVPVIRVGPLIVDEDETLEMLERRILLHIAHLQAAKGETQNINDSVYYSNYTNCTEDGFLQQFAKTLGLINEQILLCRPLGKRSFEFSRTFEKEGEGKKRKRNELEPEPTAIELMLLKVGEKVDGNDVTTPDSFSCISCSFKSILGVTNKAQKQIQSESDKIALSLTRLCADTPVEIQNKLLPQNKEKDRFPNLNKKIPLIPPQINFFPKNSRWYGEPTGASLLQQQNAPSHEQRILVEQIKASMPPFQFGMSSIPRLLARTPGRLPNNATGNIPIELQNQERALFSNIGHLQDLQQQPLQDTHGYGSVKANARYQNGFRGSDNLITEKSLQRLSDRDSQQQQHNTDHLQQNSVSLNQAVRGQHGGGEGAHELRQTPGNVLIAKKQKEIQAQTRQVSEVIDIASSSDEDDVSYIGHIRRSGFKTNKNNETTTQPRSVVLLSTLRNPNMGVVEEGTDFLPINRLDVSKNNISSNKPLAGSDDIVDGDMNIGTGTSSLNGVAEGNTLNSRPTLTNEKTNQQLMKIGTSKDENNATNKVNIENGENTRKNVQSGQNFIVNKKRHTSTLAGPFVQSVISDDSSMWDLLYYSVDDPASPVGNSDNGLSHRKKLAKVTAREAALLTFIETKNRHDAILENQDCNHQKKVKRLKSRYTRHMHGMHTELKGYSTQVEDINEKLKKMKEENELLKRKLEKQSSDHRNTLHSYILASTNSFELLTSDV